MIKLIQDVFLKVGISIKLVRPENNTWLQSRGINTVLDIGANTGQFAKRINEILPEVNIISFEPIKKCHDELVLNTKNLKVTAFNCALGEAEEEQTINISAHTPSSSLLKMADLHTEVFAGTNFIETEVISIKRLDDIFSDLALTGKIMVKIDVQGFEDRVIKGGMNTLKKADLILIETSFEELYEGQLLFDGIYQLLANLGFIFKGNLTQAINRKDGKILYAESIFINSN